MRSKKLVETFVLSLMMFGSTTLPNIVKTYDFKTQEECSITLHRVKDKYIDEYLNFYATCYKETQKKG
mgnify:CR=1 FL=1